jgi:hypothetical protein
MFQGLRFGSPAIPSDRQLSALRDFQKVIKTTLFFLWDRPRYGLRAIERIRSVSISPTDAELMEVNMKHKIEKPAAASEPAQPQAKAAQQDTAEIEMNKSKEHATHSKSDDPTLPPTLDDRTLSKVPKQAVSDTKPDAASEARSSASRNPDIESGHAEAATVGDGGPGSAASAGKGVAPSGAKGAGKPLTAKQCAANVRNAQRSTGPQTAAGKQKSSLNAYQQGFYAKHLFPTTVEWQRDGSDYEQLARGIRDYYHPQNFMEELCVEKLVMEHMRLARITRQEQQLLTSKYAFNDPAMDKILRARNSAEKAISERLRELERFRDTRKAAFGGPGTDWPGDSGNNGGSYPSPAVGPQGGVNTGGEPALPEGSEDCPESGADVWVESEKVIFQGPPEFPAPDSNNRVEAKGGTASHHQSGKSNPIIEHWISANRGGPTKGENKPPDSLARAVYEAIGEPYPYDEAELARSESAKTNPTGQSKAESEVSPHDKLNLAPKQNAETKPILTAVRPDGLEE